MTDINLQKVHKDLSKGITAMCQYFMLAQNSAQDKQLLTDAISLTANASHSINVFRRMAFKPELNKEYAALCAKNKPIEETLFGSLTDEAKACAETAKITNKISKKRNHPYKSQSSGKNTLFF